MSDSKPKALRMTLKKGVIDEYRRRHDAIWPELRDLLEAAGLSDYSIFLDDRDGCTLFAVLTEAEEGSTDRLASDPIMRRWWHFMADLMETDADDRPISHSMARMFHLP